MAEETLPAWLKLSFIRRILQLIEETSNEIEYVTVRCKEAIPAGSNFLSDVYRVFIDYKMPGTDSLKETSIFIKIPLSSGPNKEFLDKHQIYERETKVYNEILPKMYALHPARIAPHSYSEVPMSRSLVLEDLRRKGYKMLERLKQVDFEHCCHFFVALGEFHAMSFMLHRQEPELVESVGQHLLFNYNERNDEQKEHLRKLIIGMLESFSTVLGEIDCEKYSEKIRDVRVSYWDNIVRILKPEKGVNVLSHGDCWVSNILFGYDNKKIVGTKLVDFQTSFYTSFAVDILTFWWSSANEEVRENHRDELFQIYRDALNKTLEELNSDFILTKEDFDSEIKRVAPFSINVISFTASTCLADPDDFVDMKKWDLKTVGDSQESPLLKNYRSKYFKVMLPKLMEQGEAIGMFQQNL